MKIANTKPTQFSHIKVSCSDLSMAKILSMSPGCNLIAEAVLDQIKYARECHHFCWMFFSGAKLSVSEPRNFSIYCYSSDGDDGLQAANELRMLYHLYQASRFHSLLKLRDPIIQRRELAFSYLYPPK